ncbi:hypothetical protein KSF_084960 [Reticulibacter mediterranei]|uniref:Uncharacterized protein n=1 Tax=Reticulibacter mediterranei TaxID=2778369 RepID=A0A8J3IQN1_9CHLR|nr:hypothetical protein [Reticulibacter mediterranei]GHO98448.1 hypothetical protein KSF_084960 [Reticulibacter mediterranei]
MITMPVPFRRHGEAKQQDSLPRHVTQMPRGSRPSETFIELALLAQKRENERTSGAT